MLIRRFLLFLFAILLSTFCLVAQEVPKVIQYQTADYKALQQNWMITQGCDDKIYVANTEGVLIFNGLNWLKVLLPEHQKPRSVYLGADCKIYVGGYECFGYIDNSNPNDPKYIPLADELLNSHGQEIWNIFGNEDQILFQSFSHLYSYQQGKIESIPIPGNIMLGANIGNEFYLPKIEQGIYQLRDNEIKDLAIANQLPIGSKIAGLCAYPNGIALASQHNGIFIITDNELSGLSSPFNELFKKEQINKLIRLPNGDFVVGTILNGLYVTPDFKNIKYHFNKSNGLTNNTILSLFTDNNNGLWIGTDNGINYQKIDAPLSYYYDRQGKLGNIFAAIRHQGSLYLGTNQGVFKSDEQGNYNLVQNSQGQVWSLIEIDGDLLCGHNRGTFLIKEDRFERISTITGGWCMKAIGAVKILQSTYNGLIVLEKTNGRWSLRNHVENGPMLLTYFELSGEQVLGYHDNSGLSIIELDEDFRTVLSTETLANFKNINLKLPTPIYANSEGLYFSHQDSFFIWTKNKFVPVIIDAIKREPDFSRKYNFYKAVAAIPGSKQFSNFHHMDPRNLKGPFLVGFEEGYILIPEDFGSQPAVTVPLKIDYMLVSGKNLPITPGIELAPRENNISLSLMAPAFESQELAIEYRVKNWYEAWRKIPGDGILNFINMNDGKYEVQLKYQDQKIQNYLSFEIKPRWYESWPGLLLYTLLALALAYFLNQRQQRKLQLQAEELKKEKDKELESERMRNTNEKLKHDVLYKSKMLANSTLALLQKNKMLDELKNVVAKDDFSLLTEAQYKQRILHLINRNINSDEDWEIFEKNFAQVHQDFLTKLKATHPNITAGEQRMAAYIRMDLSSKEIAPLMNISYRSVENKRYRLRKKMGLPSDYNLSDYLLRL